MLSDKQFKELGRIYWHSKYFCNDTLHDRQIAFKLLIEMVDKLGLSPKDYERAIKNICKKIKL